MARALAILVCLPALGLSGCLGGDEPPARVRGNTVVVYSSLPASGVSAPAARAVAAGERLALERAGGRAGRLRVRLVQLDAARAGEGPWSPDQVDANAERAASDPKAIAYLGELAYGASAVSVPITNEGRLLQVSPTDTLTSLTTTPPGRPRAGPERYYPTGRRSFARLVPNDELLAQQLLELAAARGARRVAVLFDGDIYSRELAGQLVFLARRGGPRPVHSEEHSGRTEELPETVRRLAEARPDAIAYAGIAQRGTARLLAQLGRHLPGVPVYASSGVLDRDPARALVEPEARTPPEPRQVVRALAPVAPLSQLPAGARRLARRLVLPGEDAARPEALYGYEAMRLVLDAIRAGGRDRERVRRAAMRMCARRSPLGSYGVRATGDVNSERFALWTLEDGRFEFVRMVG